MKLSIAAAFLLATASVAAAAAAQAPNLIFLFPDDLGYGDVSYMDASIISPNIEQLASEGVKLRNHYTANWCAPSRGQLLTGRYWPQNGYGYGRESQPNEVGGTGGLSLQWKLLPEVLADSPTKYESYGFGKWHLGMYTEAYLPENRGFDAFTGYFNAFTEYPTHALSAGACGIPVRDFWQNGPITDETLFHSPETEGFEPDENVFSTKVFTDMAIQRIEDTPADTSLFLYMAYQDIHQNQRGQGLAVPRKYFDMYADEHCPYTVANDSSWSSKTNCEPREGERGTTDNCYCNRLVKRAKVTFLDEQIGRLIQALKDNGRYENSIIVFSGDNGADVDAAGSAYPLFGQKFTTFEGGVRPAAFVHSPLLSNSPYTGGWYEGIVHQVDWLTTFAAAAGATGAVPVEQASGIDIWNALQGTGEERSEALLSPGVLRVDNWKLIVENPSTRSGNGVDIQDCLLSFGGEPFPPATTYAGNVDLCGTPTCGNATDAHDAWLCSEAPCSREQPCLFNLEIDPSESNNVAESRPQRVGELLARLDELRVNYWEPLAPADNGQYCPTAILAEGYASPWMEALEDCPGQDKRSCLALCDGSGTEHLDFINAERCVLDCERRC
jgi:arylsulfatase A-like enzyme